VAKTKKVATEVQVDRRNGKSKDRRQQNTPVLAERRKAPRRRQIDPTTCERDYTQDEIEFMHALDEYKHKSGRMFPTCSEILEVVRALGYVKLAPEAAQPEHQEPVLAP
jgi:hypothetical protein